MVFEGKVFLPNSYLSLMMPFWPTGGGVLTLIYFLKSVKEELQDVCIIIRGPVREICAQ